MGVVSSAGTEARSSGFLRKPQTPTMIATMGYKLDTPVQYVKRVGPRRAKVLEAAGIHRAEDLLHYFPFRYEDRTRIRTIDSLRAGEETVIEAIVLLAQNRATARRNFTIFELMVRDATGAIPVKFFNQPYLEKVFRRDTRVILFGAPQYDSYSGGLQFLNPEFELIEGESELRLHTGRIVPIYRKVGVVTPRIIRGIVFGLLAGLEETVDPLPEKLRRAYGFPEQSTALRQIHFPEAPAADSVRGELIQQLEERTSPAHRRFAYEEFFRFQLGLHIVRQERGEKSKGRKIVTGKQVRDRLKQILPFHPTEAQKRVLREIVEDLKKPRPMSRLLQGDVGSGKTIVALQAAAVVIENGYQTALMAPTEILAEQHYATVSRYLRAVPYRVALLTGSVRGRDRKEILGRLEAGEIDLIVGTHALLESPVKFQELGLAVIDEQHRFGVLQRSRLMEKANEPDTLVMTATPIPRSLALTVYGDLDVSIIDELPPGRKPVRTVIKSDRNRAEVYEALGRELAAGRQAYVVYPLIEESEKVDLRAASEMAEVLQREFPAHRVGLLHGRMSAQEKDAVMQEFKEERLQLLVATTVIEVGIDVPGATVMVIEHAERFGLSQLHQLRGRIGRGNQGGLCILIVERARSREAYERLEIMRRTNDGFKIAEKDLEIRGPGQFVGTRQSGVPEFVFAHLVRDRKLLELARRDAGAYLSRLIEEGVHGRIDDLARDWRRRYRLFDVG